MDTSREAEIDGTPMAWSDPLATDSNARDDAGDAAEASLRQAMRLIEEQGQIGVWWHDVATDEITVSPGLARISGIPVTVRRTREMMLQAIHPQDRPYQDDQLRLIELGHPLRREFRIVRPDGTIRWVSCKIDVVLGRDGKPVRFIGVMTDITEKQEAQRAILYNQQRRLALMEAVSAHMWRSDAAGSAIDFSAYYRLTGLSAADCEGDGWAQAVHPDDRDRVLTSFKTAIRYGSIYETEHRVRTAAGTYRRMAVRAVPVRDGTGTILEWQGVTLPSDNPTGAADPDEDDLLPLTGPQIRGARGLLDWSLAQLAAASGVSVSTIKRMEDGSEGSTRPSKSGAVRRALLAAGIMFRTIEGVTWISR